MSGCKHPIWKILSAGTALLLMLPSLALGEFGVCPPYSKTFGPDNSLDEIVEGTVEVIDSETTTHAQAMIVNQAAALARERPFWTPGTAHGYHARSFGFLLGELLHLLDLLAEFLGPLGQLLLSLRELLGLSFGRVDFETVGAMAIFTATHPRRNTPAAESP